MSNFRKTSKTLDLDELVFVTKYNIAYTHVILCSKYKLSYQMIFIKEKNYIHVGLA